MLQFPFVYLFPMDILQMYGMYEPCERSHQLGKCSILTCLTSLVSVAFLLVHDIPEIFLLVYNIHEIYMPKYGYNALIWS